ncbi:hypothetical protein [Gardnerella sp. KA00255]|uniref:hypothetical protein n=1 Tax=Gardnerella sp. KA00255 TaxID=2749073 RepID=UPI003BACE2BC
MEQFNQNGSNDIDNYESNEQNQTNPNNDNGLHDQGESVAVNNSVNNSANNSNGNDRYQQNQPSQNQQYQQNQYQQSQYAHNQNWYGQYPNQYQNSQYQNSQYYNNQEYVNNQYNQNANNFSAQYPDNYTVNSNGTGSYSSDYVKQSAPYNAMNAGSSNVVHDNTQKKKQLQKWQESLNAFIMLGIVCVVVIVGFTMFKGPREFICGTTNYIINFIQGRDENGIPQKDYSTWSRKDLEGKGLGLRPYDPKTDEDKFDNKGFERDLNMPKDYSTPSVIESEEDAGGQVGPILKNRVANNKQDEQQLFNLYKFYCTNEADYSKSKDIITHHKYSTKGQADFIGLLSKSQFGDNTMCVEKDDGTREPSGRTVWEPILLSYSDQNRNKPTYVDKNGNAVDYYKSAHRDSLMSVARYMLYEQGFERTTVTPGGVVGIVDVPDSSEDDYYGYRIYQLVIPSKDNPNKFDVFIYAIHLKSYLDHSEDKYVLVFNPFLSVEQAIVLRDTNKHILPFRVVIHDIDRPLNNTPTNDDRYNTELLKVMKKFGIKIK